MTSVKKRWEKPHLTVLIKNDRALTENTLGGCKSASERATVASFYANCLYMNPNCIVCALQGQS